MWGFSRKPEPPPLPAPEPAAEMAVTTMPPTVNPTPDQNLVFAQWRADHIDRWLADPDNHSAPADKIKHLMNERNMYRLLLG